MSGSLRSSILRLVVIIVSLSQFVNAAVVTLYRVNPPVVGEHTSTEMAGSTVPVTPLGPGASGMTRYQEVDVYTRVVLHESGQDPKTIISTPVTKTFNFQQGPSTMEASNPRATSLDPKTGEINPASSIECSMSLEQQSGKCVEEVELPVTAEGARVVGTSSVTTTFTGSVEAFATVDVPNFTPSTKTISAPSLSNTAINSRITININVTVWRSSKLVQVLAGIGLIVILCRFFMKD